MLRRAQRCGATSDTVTRGRDGGVSRGVQPSGQVRTRAVGVPEIGQRGDLGEEVAPAVVGQLSVAASVLLGLVCLHRTTKKSGERLVASGRRREVCGTWRKTFAAVAAAAAAA